MDYKTTVNITNHLSDTVRHYLTYEPKNEDECLSEDETYVVTAKFPDGKKMDIKCCGVQYRENECNTAWTEAVLFDSNGAELCCTEPGEIFTGAWILEDNGNVYTAIVKDRRKTTRSIPEILQAQEEEAREKLHAKYEEIMEEYAQTSDVCFQEFASTVLFGGFPMTDIVELYGALSNFLDGDIVERVNYERVGETYGKGLLEERGLKFDENIPPTPEDEPCPF